MVLGDSVSLASARTARTAPSISDPLGSPLAGGELPHLTACALHVLRAGVVEALSEAGLRRLLPVLMEAVLPGSGTTTGGGTVATTPAPPTSIVALEGENESRDKQGGMDEARSVGGGNSVDAPPPPTHTPQASPCS